MVREAIEMAKIYSMASNDVVIPTYQAKKPGEVSENKIAKAIVIKGKANVADKETGKTPAFVMTEVTADELKILEANPAFKRKVKAGFISVGSEPATKKADKSAQMTKDDAKVKNAKATVKTNTESDE